MKPGSMRKIKLFHCGDPGVYDKYHPSYVSCIEKVPEILYLIAHSHKFELRREDIPKKLEIDSALCRKALEALERINAISIRDGRIKLNFAVFLERDISLLEDWNRNIAQRISQKIISKKAAIVKNASRLAHYDTSNRAEILYHIIACYTLDWQALELFSEKGLLRMGKPQPGNRNYVLTGYEESQRVFEYSDSLFCSSNNISVDKFTFSSFGDSNGWRINDMRGFITNIERIVVGGIRYERLGLLYNKLLREFHQSTIFKFGELLHRIANGKTYLTELNDEDQRLLSFLQEMQYVSYKDSLIHAKVPIFEPADTLILKDIAKLILFDIFEDVQTALIAIAKEIPEFTPIRHDVDPADTANPIWHHVFGLVNEQLMSNRLIASPKSIETEGRYLKALYMEF